MKKDLNYYIARSFLGCIAQKNCPYAKNIPRTGERAKKIDCFSLMIQKRNGKKLLIGDIDIDSNCIHAYEWDGSVYGIHRQLSIEDIASCTIRLNHYHGLSTIYINSFLSFFYCYFTKIPYFKIKIINFYNNTLTFFLSRKEIRIANRWKILKCLVQEGKGGVFGEGITLFEVIDLTHTKHWIVYKNNEDVIDTVKLHLDSFVESHDIIENSGKYSVQGRAFATLDAYERERRKSLWKNILTIIVIIVTCLSIIVTCIKR